MGKLTPNLKPAKRFAADLPVIGISVAERLVAKVPAAEIAKTIHTVYGYKITPERLARLVRPWRTQIKKGQQGSMTVPSAKHYADRKGERTSHFDAPELAASTSDILSQIIARFKSNFQ